MKTCTLCKRSLPLEDFHKKSIGSKDGRQSRCKDCNKETSREFARTTGEKQRRESYGKQRMQTMPTKVKLYYAAKRRAARYKVPFTITTDDIHIPDICPALGIKLVAGNRKGPRPDAPSLDRIEPELGYTPENIQVISHKANSMKRNASQEELIAFATWVLKEVVWE